MVGSETKYASYRNIHGSLPKLYTWKYHWAYIAPISIKRDKTQKPCTKCTIHDSEIALPYTGKEENIHFAVLRRIRKQKERTISRRKEQVAINIFITVLLFGLFVKHENLNPITAIAWNSTSFAYSKFDKWLNLQEKCKNSGKNVRFSVFQSEVRPVFSKTSKKKEQSATVPKDIYCYRYCFLETKERMHNEVGTCAEILPAFHLWGTYKELWLLQCLVNYCWHLGFRFVGSNLFIVKFNLPYKFVADGQIKT